MDASSTTTPRSSSINAARWDATKHRALAVVGDALETVAELDAALGDWKAPDRPGPTKAQARVRRVEHAARRLPEADERPGADLCPGGRRGATPRPGERDLLITAAGGLPGEVVKGWRVKEPNTFDCEFGFSCMGYEIAAGWGCAMADPARTPIVMIGDGTYMMMNSDIYSSVLSGHKMILVVCDNGGYARDQPPAERQGRRLASTT